MLEIMPPIIREACLRPGLEADFEVGDLSIQFSCHDEPIIRFINAEVRGNDDPFPALAAICQPNGWSVVSAADNSIVDLSRLEGSTWQRFREWRDKALNRGREAGP